jgi:glutamate synthase domain-containing protein 2|tara:strand:- start:551 stop:1303 length:753 start_codon:yes stop_codon:yes gene_type:complete
MNYTYPQQIQNQQIQYKYYQQQIQNQYYQQQIQNQYYQQQMRNQYYQQQMRNQYYQQQMDNHFKQHNLLQFQHQNQMNNNITLINQYKSKNTNLEISEDEYLKSDKDIKKKYKKCTLDNCSKSSFYHLKQKMFYKIKKINVICRSCYKPGMKGMHGTVCCEDSIYLTPQLCFSKAIYGFAGRKPIRCSRHKLKNMININISLCQFIDLEKNRCKNNATYGMSRRERCHIHKIEGMKKILIRKNRKTKKNL